jgi:DNA-binding HxlR family transcriptional regulator
MALFDLLGRRWSMGVIWQLSKGTNTFRGLQSLCQSPSGQVAPSILNTRIKDLTEARLVERTLEGYQLTPLGRSLFSLIEPLNKWSHNWEKEIGGT